jgi:hypothetical protein
MSQFCGSGFLSRSKVTSAACAEVDPTNAQAKAVRYVADFVDMLALL